MNLDQISRLKIQNSKSKIQNSKLKFQNSKFKIQNSKFKILISKFKSKLRDSRFKIQIQNSKFKFNVVCWCFPPGTPPCPDLACEVARATTIYTPRFLPAPSSIKSTRAEMKSSSSGRPTKPSPASRKKSLEAIRQGG